jgi:signal transduction histidine kinase
VIAAFTSSLTTGNPSTVNTVVAEPMVSIDGSRPAPFRAIPGLVWCAAPDGEVNYLNQRMLDHTGTTPGTWEQGWNSFLHREDVEPTEWACSRAIATGNAHEIQCRLEERLAERTRIARDFHDTLLQGFQGIMLRLQVIDGLLPSGKAKVELERTLQQGDEAIVGGPSAVQDLRLLTLTTNDLAQAVTAVAGEPATDDDASLCLVVEGPVRELQPIVRDELYRIVREMLRNAFSHARVHKIEAEITYAERLLRIRIRDDGTGLPMAILGASRSGHYGLPGVRERATQTGEKLDIWSGAGSEIESNIPGSIAYRVASGWPRFRWFRRKGG